MSPQGNSAENKTCNLVIRSDAYTHTHTQGDMLWPKRLSGVSKDQADPHVCLCIFVIRKLDKNAKYMTGYQLVHHLCAKKVNWNNLIYFY